MNLNETIVVSLALLLAGCASSDVARSRASPPNAAVLMGCQFSSTPKTFVNLSAFAVDTVDPNRGTLTVDVYRARIPQGCAAIRWSITAPGYELSSDAVAFDKPSVAPQGPTFGLAVGPNYWWFFNSYQDAEWEYSLSFQTAAGGTTIVKWRCDPTVINHDIGVIKKLSGTVDCTKQP